jgi:hypothetical protein
MIMATPNATKITPEILFIQSKKLEETAFFKLQAPHAFNKSVQNTVANALM